VTGTTTFLQGRSAIPPAANAAANACIERNRHGNWVKLSSGRLSHSGRERAVIMMVAMMRLSAINRVETRDGASSLTLESADALCFFQV